MNKRGKLFVIVIAIIVVSFLIPEANLAYAKVLEVPYATQISTTVLFFRRAMELQLIIWLRIS